MKIEKHINKNWLLKQETRKSDFYKRNKSFRELSKKNKVGKYAYNITDNFGHRSIHMINISHWDTGKMVFEILGHHGQDTKTFNTYNQAIKWIQEYYDGKIEQVHICECGCYWKTRN